ncbi:MAG: hypothetical protein WCK11_00200 [Candidatus Falkowbacteria bacterium]
MAKIISTHWRAIMEECWYCLSLGGAFLVLLELVWPGVVLSVINLDYFLLFWLIFGMILLLTPRKA